MYITQYENKELKYLHETDIFVEFLTENLSLKSNLFKVKENNPSSLQKYNTDTITTFFCNMSMYKLQTGENLFFNYLNKYQDLNYSILIYDYKLFSLFGDGYFFYSDDIPEFKMKKVNSDYLNKIRINKLYTDENVFQYYIDFSSKTSDLTLQYKISARNIL